MNPTSPKTRVCEIFVVFCKVLFTLNGSLLKCLMNVVFCSSWHVMFGFKLWNWFVISSTSQFLLKRAFIVVFGVLLRYLGVCESTIFEIRHDFGLSSFHRAVTSQIWWTWLEAARCRLVTSRFVYKVKLEFCFGSLTLSSSVSPQNTVSPPGSHRKDPNESCRLWRRSVGV